MHQDNYSWAARQKQWEEGIVQKAVPPTDLSQIDPAEHHLHDHSQLFAPQLTPRKPRLRRNKRIEAAKKGSAK